MIRILENTLSDQMISALGNTFLHSLWIGGALSMILFFILLMMRGSNPRKRYFAGVLLLTAFLVANLFVFTIYASRGNMVHDGMYPDTNTSSVSRISMQTVDLTTEKSILKKALGYFEQNKHWFVLFWFSGIMLLGLKFLGGLIYCKRLKRYGTRPLGGNILQIARRISGQFGIAQKIRILESGIVKVPLILGYFKPVVILPVSVLLQIPQDQIEAILSHELAHIKRKDNIVNFLQSIVEIIFFYHPATWWISGLIRKEREEVCDDMALEICPNRLKYAKALMNLEETRQERGAFALAFTGQKNTLVNRIKRLMMKKEGRTNYFAGLLASLTILAALALLSSRADAFGPADKQVINSRILHFDTPGITSREVDYTPDTLKNKAEKIDNSYVVYSADRKGKNIAIQIVNGEIKLLAIDGEEIDPENYGEYEELIKEIDADIKSNQEERLKERMLRRKEREKMMEERRTVEKEMRKDMNARQMEKKIIMDSLHKSHQERAERMREELIVQKRLQKEEIREMIEEQIEQLEKIKNDTNLLKEYYGIGRRMPHPSSPYIHIPGDENAYEYKFFSEPELPELPELPEMGEDLKWIYLDEPDKPEIYVDVENELQRPAGKEKFMDKAEGNLFIYRTPENDRAGFNESITRQRLRNELKKDKLIDFFNEKEVYLTKKELIVDGEKQPRKLMKKYRDMYEALSGKEIGKDEIIEIQ